MFPRFEMRTHEIYSKGFARFCKQYLPVLIFDLVDL